MEIRDNLIKAYNYSSLTAKRTAEGMTIRTIVNSRYTCRSLGPNIPPTRGTNFCSGRNRRIGRCWWKYTQGHGFRTSRELVLVKVASDTKSKTNVRWDKDGICMALDSSLSNPCVTPPCSNGRDKSLSRLTDNGRDRFRSRASRQNSFSSMSCSQNFSIERSSHRDNILDRMVDGTPQQEGLTELISRFQRNVCQMDKQEIVVSRKNVLSLVLLHLSSRVDPLMDHH
ncbi:unnamed protein product [Mytilus coruscus]|uniref:Uncharacterized protein n=1 Tax=Mytilus coruscus TaxID=42192 RepID=A0A6J8E9Q4_MYTCO|nr:unnamed protein product [Mytilus coruscus]